MFEALAPLPADPILGISAAYAADTAPTKVDVGVGVYRDDSGKTPVMQAVRAAEALVLERETTKSYQPATGNAAFNAAMTELVLGLEHPAVVERRAVTLQTPGGCGALRIAADLVNAASPGAVVALSTPTWANHGGLLGSSGLPLRSYPYYDLLAHRVDFAAMCTVLSELPADSLVVLQPSCHNPTGADLDTEQWEELIGLLRGRGLVPLLDLAYQGLGAGLEADAYWVRRIAAELPESLITVSCSKNFGLYRERTGAVIYVGRNATEVHAVHTHLMVLARRMYSMPPDYGAALVAAIWADRALRDQWTTELESMRLRLAQLRHELAQKLELALPDRDYGYIREQRGMFSLLGASREAVEAMRVRHHVYCAPDSRMNIAGLNSAAIDRLVEAVVAET